MSQANTPMYARVASDEVINYHIPTFLREKMAKAKIEKAKAMKRKIDEFEKKLSKIAGLRSLKSQLQSWAKQSLMDERRRLMRLDMGNVKIPHIAFLGNPGTGKTTVARMLGDLLYTLGMIWSNKVVEVQRTDLVGYYIGHTGPKTREKIEEAKGGVLFVDEVYRLMPADNPRDFGIEALEEIMSFMDSGETLVIFAGYAKQMQRVISANDGFRRRVTMFFHFDDYTCRDLADIARLKMSSQGRESPLYGFKLHSSCNAEGIERVIREETTEKQRSETNGGLVDEMLAKARENLDNMTDIWCEDIDSLVIITMDDIAAGLRLLRHYYEADGDIDNKMAIENIGSNQLAETKEKLLKLLLEAAEDEVKNVAKRNLEKKKDGSKTSGDGFMAMLFKSENALPAAGVFLGFIFAGFLISAKKCK